FRKHLLEHNLVFFVSSEVTAIRHPIGEDSIYLEMFNQLKSRGNDENSTLITILIIDFPFDICIHHYYYVKILTLLIMMMLNNMCVGQYKVLVCLFRAIKISCSWQRTQNSH